MKQILVINDHDYTQYIKQDGYHWSREDLDSENTVRVKTGTLRRDKIGTKRKLSYDLMDMQQEILAQLDDDLSKPTFKAKFLDLHGVQTRTFYCSSFPANLTMILQNGFEMWQGASFSMTEV